MWLPYIPTYGGVEVGRDADYTSQRSIEPIVLGLLLLRQGW
jgi:hypothetical protein